MTEERYCQVCEDEVEVDKWIEHLRTNRHLNRQFIQQRVDMGEITKID